MLDAFPRSASLRDSRSRAAGVALAAAVGLAVPAVAQVNPLAPNAPPATRATQPVIKPPPPPPTQAQPAEDGPSYPISAFVVRYATEQPDRPALDDLLQSEVTLGLANGVYVAPRPGAESVTLRLSDLASTQRAARPYSVSAINAIGARIVQALNQRGIIGVLVSPDPNQIDPQTLADKRPQGVQTLTLDVWTRAVSQVRTIGAGPRWAKPTAPDDRPSQETRINNRVHDRIRENSPLQPGPQGQPGDLLRKDLLSDYLDQLNRHPGREVDAAIAPGDQPGEVVLDYIVTENKPWTAYFQVSNTGTKQTDEWRERFGFVDNQLLNRDDVLSIDYITAGFTDANALIASYDAPFGNSQVLRWKAYGSASDYKASDVGFANEKFKGDTLYAGGELSLNVYQHARSFIDVFGGARWERDHVNNEIVDVSGKTDFFIPYGGLRFDRDTGKSSTYAEVRIEGNLGGWAGTSQSEAEKLGRLFVDKNWTAFKWDLSESFYLEPLLFRSAWSNPDSPYRKTTLAHEIFLSLRGQEAFDSRLVPQQEAIAGGLYSVRGYPESIAAGDNSIMFTAEYRFHLPRVLMPQNPETTPFLGKPFRFAPEQRYGRPDWDLIFRGFVDAARITNNNKQSFESDETLIGAGVGAELQFRQNVSLRVDWGFALRDAAGTNAGDNRVHFVGTILY